MFSPIAHMWFDNKIFEADTTEDQSGTPMEKVVYTMLCYILLWNLIIHEKHCMACHGDAHSWRKVTFRNFTRIGPSRVFWTFDMDQWGKICWHHWKDRLKISKTATKFESDMSYKVRKDIAPQGCTNLQTSVKFCDFD